MRGRTGGGPLVSSIDRRARARDRRDLGAAVAAGEKLFKYMDIEPRFVTPSVEGPEKAGAGWRVDPSRVAAEIDDKTIGVVVIMGNHYSGHYDPVLKVAEVVRAVNKAKGLDVGIHVDAASGGFVAPFQDGLEKWDFRVPTPASKREERGRGDAAAADADGPRSFGARSR